MTHSEAVQKLDSFKDLKENWDSYGGRPISPKAIDCAKAMLFRLGPGWQPVPMSDGGVLLEGMQMYCDVMIEISSI